MKLLRKILFPFSLLYAVIVHVRNYCYDIGIFKSKSFGTPSICVGNLSAGGTGKTPMVEYLIAQLQEHYKLAVLSRGYRRKSKGYILADSHTTVENIGDEPFQIYSKFPEITVAVDADRRNGISILEATVHPDIIILDDAFQHRKVKPDFLILLTAFKNLYVDDWYLPTGNLRDSKREAKRADLIVVTKCPKDLSKEEQAAIIKKLKPKVYQQVLFSYLKYASEIKGANGIFDLENFEKKKITLVTGIANPEPLVAYLKGKGLVFEHLKFKDHHFFSEKELELLKKKECILTTEKDYVRLKCSLNNLYYIAIEHQFLEDYQGIIKKELKNRLLNGLF